ncbi:MAG: hypothetical protein K0Q70_529 [Rhodospirillales bacterium]|jgi:hypothetical protein|nr:hypothetical protein [Rhodospirillales bacterium]
MTEQNVPPSASAPKDADADALIHALNNILGVVIGCFDEQIEQLDARGDLNRVKLRQLAEDGLAAALRGAALTRQK